jgi:hypothetical protein
MATGHKRYKPDCGLLDGTTTWLPWLPTSADQTVSMSIFCQDLIRFGLPPQLEQESKYSYLKPVYNDHRTVQETLSGSEAGGGLYTEVCIVSTVELA